MGKRKINRSHTNSITLFKLRIECSPLQFPEYFRLLLFIVIVARVKAVLVMGLRPWYVLVISCSPHGNDNADCRDIDQDQH